MNIKPIENYTKQNDLFYNNLENNNAKDLKFTPHI